MKLERPALAVIVESPGAAAQLIHALEGTGLASEDVRVAMHGPETESSLVEQVHTRSVATRSPVKSLEEYLRQLGAPEVLLLAGWHQRVFEEGAVISELAPDQLPTEQEIHILAGYALPGGILTSPPFLPPRKKK